MWGLSFYPISKDLRCSKSWDVEHQNGGLAAWQVKTMSHKAQEHSGTWNCPIPAVT